ncbi:MAG: CPBP family intramembrane metalloprotease [Alphaproteobacteria bacterium]|nr:MAG: CPBP family intramembrane metalloprotease [Alphaproteobacteria bacterium]
MIGLVLLAVTWLLLRLEGQPLAAIGLDKGWQRSAEGVAGFVFMGFAATVQQLGHAAAAGDAFRVNDALQPAALLDGLRFVVNSVLFEELLFRGYLLFQAVRWLGHRRAVWLDAAVFGAYHWFSYGVIGNPVAMAYVLVMTGAVGLMLARAFVATGSVVAPIGLHLGWNAVTYLVFSAGPQGAVLLVPAGGAGRVQAGGIAGVALNMVWPLLVVAVAIWCCRRYERVTAPAAGPA